MNGDAAFSARPPPSVCTEHFWEVRAVLFFYAETSGLGTSPLSSEILPDHANSGLALLSPISPCTSSHLSVGASLHFIPGVLGLTC